MAHVSFEALRTQLSAAAEQVVVNACYTHYKHPDVLYRVVGFTVLEATDEVAVRYCPLAAEDIEFTRPLASWLAAVEWQDQTVPRFTEVSD